MQFNTELTIDLDEVKNFIESSTFTQFLLEKAPSFECAAFVLQKLMDAVDEAAQSLDNSNNI
jgi:hypothetical protein